MPCDSVLENGQSTEQRQRQIDTAVKRLERALMDRRVGVVIGFNGAIAFNGNWDREGVGDVCAYRRLSASGSFALRSAIAAAEATSGRKVNEQAIAAGHHSHDKGKTWGRD